MCTLHGPYVLLYADRLYATDHDWPWESSGSHSQRTDALDDPRAEYNLVVWVAAVHNRSGIIYANHSCATYSCLHRWLHSIFSGSTVACPQCCGEVYCRSDIARHHVTGTLRDVHWLPVRTRITYKLCTAYACVCESVPRRSTSETSWPRWLNCLVARTLVLLRLVYTTCHAHGQNLGPDRSQLPDRQHGMLCH